MQMPIFMQILAPTAYAPTVRLNIRLSVL